MQDDIKEKQRQEKVRAWCGWRILSRRVDSVRPRGMAVQVASLMQAAVASPASHAELLKQLAPALPGLRDGWLALLRDFALLDTEPAASHRAYRPHLYASAMARSEPFGCGVCSSFRTVKTQMVESRKTQPQKPMKLARVTRP